MGVQFLDDTARSAFKRAIEAVENSSAVEVVVAVRRRSGEYRHANLIVGALVAFVGLAAMLFSSETFHLSSILIDPFVVGLLAGGAIELLPQIKRALTSQLARRRHVQRAARATFVERGVHNTRGRSGMLVYISWLEREVAIVADTGLAKAVPADVLARSEAEMSRAMRAGGVAVARVLEALADAMGKAMPHTADDINELPDALDSDLASRT